ncbi:MAG: hypothetical protein IJ112_01255 [Oscillospiraceae bacterium]|nr:hypothetical protein [Oscillospiraceae bacterium]
MKRMMTLLLALVMVFALSACGDATRTDAATESAVPETTDAAATDTPIEDVPEAVESMAPQMNDITVKDVLDRVHDYHEETVGSSLQMYSAAATLLNFCKAGGPDQDHFREDVKDYIDKLDDDGKEAFRGQYEAVSGLADQITKGDVTMEDTNAALVDADVTLEDFDPLAFEHAQLDAFNDAVKAAYEG